MPGIDDLTNAGLPIPAIYSSQSASAEKAYQDALAAIAQQQSSLAQRYGFNVQTSPDSGAVTGTEIDPRQEFSNVMSVLTQNAAGLHNLRENLAGRGLAGGGMRGLAGQRAALLKYQQQGNLANLGSQFVGQYGQLENQKAGARSTRDQGINEAAQAAINFAIQNGWFNQAAPAAPGGGGSDPAPPQENSSYDLAPPAPPEANIGALSYMVSPSQLNSVGTAALNTSPQNKSYLDQAFKLPGSSAVASSGDRVLGKNLRG
jgi:hypothetical protein